MTTVFSQSNLAFFYRVCFEFVLILLKDRLQCSLQLLAKVTLEYWAYPRNQLLKYNYGKHCYESFKFYHSYKILIYRFKSDFLCGKTFTACHVNKYVNRKWLCDCSWILQGKESDKSSINESRQFCPNMKKIKIKE